MLQAEYRHDIQKNYLVVQGRKEGNYMLHMLAGKHVHGFLPLEIREINNEKEYYYDITGKENLQQKGNQEKWREFPLKKCISQILTEIGKCREYLLNPDNLVLDPAYIYIDIQSRTVSLCYVHDYNQKINEQLSQLFSYFMNIVDYQDKDAVQIVYKLYEKSREVHCTLNDLQKIVALETRKPEIKKIDPLSIEKESKPQVQKNKKSLISSGSNRKIDRNNIEEKIDKKSNGENKHIIEKKLRRYKTKNKNKSNKRNLKENIVLTIILQIALLLLLAVAAKSDIFCDEKGISVTKSVMGLFILGALDMFILSKVFAIEEEDIENKEEYKEYEKNKKFLKQKKKIQIENKLEQEEISKEKTLSLFNKKNMEKKPFLEIKEERESVKQTKMEELFQHKMSDFERKSSVTHIEKQREIALPLENCNMGDETIKIDYDKTIVQANENLCSKKQCYLVPEEQGQELISLGEFPFFIGRFQKDTASLEQKKNISRMHSKIEKMGEQFFITDLNSTNGTFVNEKRIEKNQQIVLAEGDKVSFADIPYYFTREWKAS
ncbi:MAG: FHA domain-containing protein [Lachnospiraceae bacterium]|nr:FHA domain-containing protein [Lachnospiraceae bacterium]